MAKENRYKTGVDLQLSGTVLADANTQSRYLKKLQRVQAKNSAVYTPKESYISYNFVLKSLYGELKNLSSFAKPHDSDKTPENIRRGVVENKQKMNSLIQDVYKELLFTFPDISAQEYPETAKKYAEHTNSLPEEKKENKIDMLFDRFNWYVNEKNSYTPQHGFELSAENSERLKVLREKMQQIIEFQSDPHRRIFALNGSNLAILKELTGMLDAKMNSSEPVISKPINAKIYTSAIRKNNKLLGGDETNNFAQNLQDAANFYEQYNFRLVAVPYWKGYKYLSDQEENLKKLEADMDYRNADTTVGAAYKSYTNGERDEKGQKWTYERYNEIRLTAQQKFEDAKKEFEQKLQTDPLLKEAYHRREINQAKTCVLRASWVGYIEQPDKRFLSEALQAHLTYREANLNQFQTNETPDELEKHKQQLSAQLEQNEIWKVCEQAPGFAAHKKDLINGLISLGIPTEMVKDLKYSDITHLMNHMAKEIVNAGGKEVDGIKIESDKEKFIHRMYDEHRDDIKQMLEQEGKDKEYIDGFLNTLKNGRCPEGYDIHHAFPISDPEAFERFTGKNFMEMNKNCVLISKDVHLLPHLVENYVNKDGHSGFKFESLELVYGDEDVDANQRIGNAEAHRTLFIDKNGDMFYLSPMPEEGIDCMMDFDRCIFNAASIDQCVQNKQKDIALYEAQNGPAVKGKQTKEIPNLITVEVTRLEHSAKIVSINDGKEKSSDLKIVEINEKTDEGTVNQQFKASVERIQQHKHKEAAEPAKKVVNGAQPRQSHNLDQRRKFSSRTGRQSPRIKTDYAG